MWRRDRLFADNLDTLQALQPQLVFFMSSSRPVFGPMPVHVRYVLDNVAQSRTHVFLRPYTSTNALYLLAILVPFLS